MKPSEERHRHDKVEDSSNSNVSTRKSRCRSTKDNDIIALEFLPKLEDRGGEEEGNWMMKKSSIVEKLPSQVLDALPSRKSGTGDFLRRSYAERPEYREQQIFNRRAYKAEMDNWSPQYNI